MSIARTISSSTMLLRSSGSMTAVRASVICSRVGTASLWQLARPAPVPPELRAGGVTGDAELEHRADAATVELVLEGPWLERGVVLRQQDVVEVACGHLGLLAPA